MTRLEILVEEASMEAALREVMPRILQGRAHWKSINMGSKGKLLKALPKRLRAYRKRIDKGENLTIIVLVDRDSDNCKHLKYQEEPGSACIVSSSATEFTETAIRKSRQPTESPNRWIPVEIARQAFKTFGTEWRPVCDSAFLDYQSHATDECETIAEPGNLPHGVYGGHHYLDENGQSLVRWTPTSRGTP